MKIQFNKMLQLGLALAMAGSFAACSSSGESADGSTDGAVTDTSSDSNNNTDVTLYFITPGDSCYDIVSVANGSNDGCDLGVAQNAPDGLVGATIPFNYDNQAYTIKVGTEGSLGGGAIAFNMATLLRDGNVTDDKVATCMWHEHVDATVTFTAQDEFNISASRTQSAFTATCTDLPASVTSTNNMCTSTWTWHMKRNPAKTTANCQ